MRSRASRLAFLTGCAVLCGVLPACTSDGPRATGTPVTQAEAEVLSRLLLANHRAGGADFVITVPYGDSVVLSLDGEVDFRRAIGRAVMTTSFGDGAADDVAQLVFTREDLWFGEVPGLADVLAEAGLPDTAFVHRPTVSPAETAAPALLDVLVSVLLNLSAGTPDDPAAFLGGEYRWQGQRSIDSRLTSVFELHHERRVAVAAASDLLVQFRTPLDALDVTITLADHGARSIAVPDEADTTEIADVPAIAARLGG